jgi:hypothetical protein
LAEKVTKRKTTAAVRRGIANNLEYFMPDCSIFLTSMAWVPPNLARFSKPASDWSIYPVLLQT